MDFTDYIQFSNPSNRNISSYNDPTSEIQSLFGRVNLNWSDKYLLTATIRRDGSSKFGVNNKYGNFPSFSLAWNVNKEDFFKVDLINSLKIRGGWGKTGNQEFPAGSAQRRYNFGSNGIDLVIANNPNPDLKWQSDRQYNIGFDMTLLQNKISVTADYFNKKTTDLLFPTIPVQPAAPGGAITWANIDGEVVNKGFEIAINASIISNKDFSWDFGINGTFLKNNVSGLKAAIPTGRLNGKGSSDANVETLRNGYPINAFWTREWAGLDKNGVNVFPNGENFSYVGNPNPTKLLGISTSLGYKKLLLLVNFNGAFGHKVYNETENNVLNAANMVTGTNISYSAYKDAQKESTANPVTSSSRYVEKGDYLKLTNATLSYNIGNIGKIFKGATVFVTGQNLLVFTGYKGFDPEINVDKAVNSVPSVGIEYQPYPSARTVTAGFNVSL